MFAYLRWPLVVVSRLSSRYRSRLFGLGTATEKCCRDGGWHVVHEGALGIFFINFSCGILAAAFGCAFLLFISDAQLEPTLLGRTRVQVCCFPLEGPKSVDYGFCYPVNRPFTMCHPLTL